MVSTRVVAVLALVAALAVSCGAGDAAPTTPTHAPTVAPTTTTAATTNAPTTAPSTTPPSTTGTISSADDLPPTPDGAVVPDLLAGLPLATVAVDGEALLVAVADTGTARRRGLMQVTDLLDLDGMLFVWTDDTSGGFWMRDTVLPLDIVFFDVGGGFVNAFPMEPCDLGASCPTYDAGGTYRFALETTQGRLPGLGQGSTLVVPPGMGDA